MTKISIWLTRRLLPLYPGTLHVRLTPKNIHCCAFSSIRALKGFGALCIGGIKVVTRVAKYLPILIFSSGKLEEPICAGRALSVCIVSFVSAIVAPMPADETKSASDKVNMARDLVEKYYVVKCQVSDVVAQSMDGISTRGRRKEREETMWKARDLLNISQFPSGILFPFPSA